MCAKTTSGGIRLATFSQDPDNPVTGTAFYCKSREDYVREAEEGPNGSSGGEVTGSDAPPAGGGDASAKAKWGDEDGGGEEATARGTANGAGGGLRRPGGGSSRGIGFGSGRFRDGARGRR